MLRPAAPETAGPRNCSLRHRRRPRRGVHPQHRGPPRRRSRRRLLPPFRRPSTRKSCAGDLDAGPRHGSLGALLLGQPGERVAVNLLELFRLRRCDQVVVACDGLPVHGIHCRREAVARRIRRGRVLGAALGAAIAGDLVGGGAHEVVPVSRARGARCRRRGLSEIVRELSKPV